MIWLLWIGVIATFFRQLFARQCCSMWLWIDKASVLTSSVFFFRKWSTLKSHHFWDLVGKYFQIICCFKIPPTLGNVKRDAESQVSQASGAQCLVYVELVMKKTCVFRLSHGEDSRMMSSQLPNNAVLFSVFSVLPRPCSVYVGMLKGSCNIWMLKNKQPEKKKTSNFHDIQFFSSELQGWWLSARVETCSGDLCLSAAVQCFLCRRLHGLLGGGLFLQIASWTVHPKILRLGTSGRNSELQHVGKLKITSFADTQIVDATLMKVMAFLAWWNNNIPISYLRWQGTPRRIGFKGRGNLLWSFFFPTRNLTTILLSVPRFLILPHSVPDISLMFSYGYISWSYVPKRVLFPDKSLQNDIDMSKTPRPAELRCAQRMCRLAFGAWPTGYWHASYFDVSPKGWRMFEYLPLS